MQDEPLVLAAIMAMLAGLVRYYGAKNTMQEPQMVDLSYVILDRFPTLAVEDLYLFSVKAKAGEFLGEGLFNSLGPDKILEWLNTYDMNYVTPAREEKAKIAKLNSENNLQEIAKAVLGDNEKAKLIIRKTEIKTEIAGIKKSLWYERYKLQVKAVGQKYKGDELKIKLEEIKKELKDPYQKRWDNYKKIIKEYLGIQEKLK